MKYKNKLFKNLESKVGGRVNTRRYDLSSMISESYNTLYKSDGYENIQKLAKCHLEDVRKNPTDIDRLSRQLCMIKEALAMTEAGEIKDKDLDIATDSKLEGDVETEYERARKERGALTKEDTIEEACHGEEKDIEEDTDLTDEEIAELSRYLSEMRKDKSKDTEKIEEKGDGLYHLTKEEIDKMMKFIKNRHPKGISEDSLLYIIELVTGKEEDVSIDEIFYALEDEGIEVIPGYGDPSTTHENIDLTAGDIHEDQDQVKKFKEFNDKLNSAKSSNDLISIRQDYEKSNIGSTLISALQMVWDAKNAELKSEVDNKNKSQAEDMKKAKTFESIDLSGFAKNSSSKAFVRTFKKLRDKLTEGTALTRQESIALYKATNSAMTHLSVELEHNPEFLDTFNESVSLLSEDANKVLNSLKKGKAPSKATMKSLAKFSEALLNEAEDEEVEDSNIEDEELSVEETTEESEEFDQEYAEARVEIHKELAEEHADSEDPEIQDKLETDAQEIANLPGVTEEQLAELDNELGNGTEESTESEEDITPEDELEEKEDLSLGDEEDDELTDDEIEELKKHLTEMRAAKKIKE